MLFATDARESYWSVLLTSGKVLTERERVLDFRKGGYRNIDWQNDLNATGDLKKIKELHLISQGHYIPSYLCTWKDVIQGGEEDNHKTYEVTVPWSNADECIAMLRSDKKKAAFKSTLQVKYVEKKQHEMLKIDENYTAFQFKHRTKEFFNSTFTTLEAQCIGRVTNKESGDCECYIWDRFLGIIFYKSNIYNFGSWRQGLIPLKDLSHEVIGIRL